KESVTPDPAGVVESAVPPPLGRAPFTHGRSGAQDWQLREDPQPLFAVFSTFPPPALRPAAEKWKKGERGAPGDFSSCQSCAPLGQAQWGRGWIAKNASRGLGLNRSARADRFSLKSGGARRRKRNRFRTNEYDDHSRCGFR